MIYIASSGGHIDKGDGEVNFLVTESMALKHSAKLYPDIPGIEKLHFNFTKNFVYNTFVQTGIYNTHPTLKPIYDPHCCLLPAIAVPFYYLAIPISAAPMTVVGFVNSLILSLISLVIFFFSLQIYGSKKISFVLSVIFAVCSFAWPYNTSLSPQPLQALLLVASSFFIYGAVRGLSRTTSEATHKRTYFAGLGGLFLGFSIFAHPSTLIIIPGFLSYSFFSMRSSRKSLGVFLVVFVIISIFAGLVNYWRFGSFTDFGYGTPGQALAIHHGWVGLVGLLASPGVGLIFYLPITILLPLAFKFMHKEDRRLFFLFAYVIIVFWLYFGTLSLPGLDPATWTGTGIWGPRYLVPILPFVTIVFGAFLLQLKTRLSLKLLTIALCVSGFYLNLLGSLEWWYYAYAYAWNVLGLLKLEGYAGVHHIGINSFDIMAWDPIYSPIVLHQTLLSSDYISRLPVGESGGLAPCLYDNYVFCKMGIVSTLLLLAATAVIGILIVAEIGWLGPRLVVVYLKNFANTKRETRRRS